MELPERIWITEGRVKSLTCGVYWTSPAEFPVEDDVEYIRAEAVKRLIEAAKDARTVMDEMLDNNFSCFSDCAQWEKCSENGGMCLILARLDAALAAVEG